MKKRGPIWGWKHNASGMSGPLPVRPRLVSLYSIITLTAHLLIEKGETWVRSTAWYGKTRPTFADAIAWVRRHLWEHLHFSMSQQETDMIQIPRALLERFTEAPLLCGVNG